MRASARASHDRAGLAARGVKSAHTRSCTQLSRLIVRAFRCVALRRCARSPLDCIDPATPPRADAGRRRAARLVALVLEALLQSMLAAADGADASRCRVVVRRARSRLLRMLHAPRCPRKTPCPTMPHHPVHSDRRRSPRRRAHSAALARGRRGCGRAGSPRPTMQWVNCRSFRGGLVAVALTSSRPRAVCSSSIAPGATLTLLERERCRCLRMAHQLMR